MNIEQLAQFVTKEGYAPVLLHPEVRRLCELVRADERGACEMAVEELPPDADRGDCAAAIRARSNT